MQEKKSQNPKKYRQQNYLTDYITVNMGVIEQDQQKQFF